MLPTSSYQEGHGRERGVPQNSRMLGLENTFRKQLCQAPHLSMQGMERDGSGISWGRARAGSGSPGHRSQSFFYWDRHFCTVLRILGWRTCPVQRRQVHLALAAEHARGKASTATTQMHWLLVRCQALPKCLCTYTIPFKAHDTPAVWASITSCRYCSTRKCSGLVEVTPTVRGRAGWQI